jgi:hypothetical protein
MISPGRNPKATLTSGSANERRVFRCASTTRSKQRAGKRESVDVLGVEQQAGPQTRGQGRAPLGPLHKLAVNSRKKPVKPAIWVISLKGSERRPRRCFPSRAESPQNQPGAPRRRGAGRGEKNSHATSPPSKVPANGRRRRSTSVSAPVPAEDARERRERPLLAGAAEMGSRAGLRRTCRCDRAAHPRANGWAPRLPGSSPWTRPRRRSAARRPRAPRDSCSRSRNSSRR